MHSTSDIKLTSAEISLLWRTYLSDTFVLFYLRYLSRLGLNYYSIALPQMARQDMLDFLTSCVASSTELTRRLIKTKLEKGIYLRPPMIEIPNKIDFVDNRNFTAGFSGEKRRLVAGEVTQLFLNIHSNLIGKALLMGFIQATESGQIKSHLTKGVHIAERHMKIFREKLENEDIRVAMPSDLFVTDSTEAPFSNRLVMFKLSLMNSAGFGDYATATSTCMRHDIQADFIRLGAEIAKYAADGMNLTIDNGWMEQPPQAINHAVLSKV